MDKNYSHLIITSIEEFREIRDIWQKIYIQSENHYFSSHYWNYYWWIHFKEDRQLYIVIFLKDEIPYAILPLCYRKKFYFKKFILISSEYVASDYIDFVYLPTYKDDVRKYFICFFKKYMDRFSYFLLKDFSKDSLIYLILTSFEQKHLVEFSQIPKDYCPYILLPDRIENIFHQHSQKTIRRFMSYLNSTFRSQSVRFHVGFINNDPEISFKSFVDLHLRRIKSLRKHSHFETDPFFSFHKDVSTKDTDSATFFWIIKDNIPVAATYCYLTNNRLYYYNSGFRTDTDIKKPGQLLIYKMFEYLIETGVKEFFFLRGSEDYKYFWTSQNDTLFYAELFRSKISKFFNYLSLRYDKRSR